MSTERPALSLAEIDAFDPHGPSARKWCPMCGDDKPKDAAHRSLSVDRETGLWNCFRCGAGGLAREFWSEKPFLPSRERLKNTFSLSTKPAEPETPLLAPVDEARADVWRELWEQTQPLDATLGELYLRKRDVPLETARLAEVKWSSTWRGGAAVVFPIRDRNGELVAIQGRAVKGSAKITYGPKKNGVFEAPITLGNRFCRPCDRAVPTIVLVEAPIDALSLAACGFPALALCGTSGPSWLHLACGLRRVALAFDADAAGDAAAHAIETQISPFGARCFRLRPDGFKDWNEQLLHNGNEELEIFLSEHLLDL